MTQEIQNLLRSIRYKFLVTKLKVDMKDYQQENFRYRPIIKRTITKINENKFYLDLNCSILDSKENPFIYDVDITVRFIIECDIKLTDYLENELKKIIKQNLTFLLYPYLRTTVQMATTLMQANPIMLPLVSVETAIFNEEGLLVRY